VACPALETGNNFLWTTLTQIDCQAQTIGSYGFAVLADPNSIVFVALTGLLTIFIALFGIRLMFGTPVRGADLVDGVIRIGIVLTLATSWPAWRTLGYDLVLNGPAETAGLISSASGLGGSAPGTLVTRLQGVDDGIVTMTIYGTGRLSGGVASGQQLGDSFQGIALADQFALGIGRTAFLAGVIGPFAITRIGAGILLALAPLVAGFLLFVGTRGLFVGWLRGLVFCALASLCLFLLQGIELALFEPWISDVVAKRGGGQFTPSAPTELLVLGVSFCLLSLGLLFLASKIAFFSDHTVRALLHSVLPLQGQDKARGLPSATSTPSEVATPPRAYLISQAIEANIRRESAHDRLSPSGRGGGSAQGNWRNPQAGGSTSPTFDRTTPGAIQRRGARRASASATFRDRT
jgi:type IV secretion system protein VirB6